MRHQPRNEAPRKVSHLWLIPLLLVIGIASYLVTISAVSEKESPKASSSSTAKPNTFNIPNETPKARKLPRQLQEGDPEAEEAGAISNQRLITFSDAESMRRFLTKLGNGVSLLGSIDSLNTISVSFNNLSDLEALLDGTEETSFNYPAYIPGFEGVGAQADAEALGNNLLKWLGVEGSNSLWGKGLLIAILDTGISDHTAFQNAIQRINLVPLPENPADLNGHGTAVASLIFSNNPLAPGVAPGATPLSVRIADDNGNSSSFLIAQGIIAAVDAGASIINISLGGTGNSSVVNKALEYAQSKGAVVVASSGNSGTEGVMQPAAQPSVIAVGAVDAKNQPLAFSTTGSEVAVAAPGYMINAAYPGNSAAQVNGTSFSAPIVVGAIAGTTSNTGSPSMTTQQAANLVLNHLKDVGEQGTDNSTGGGVPDMWTILNSGSEGIYDASINSIYQSDDNQIQILVQNLGTETLINTGVSVNVNGSTTNANITTLAPNESRVITIPGSNNATLNIQGNVQISSGQNDQRPSNDSLSTTIGPPQD